MTKTKSDILLILKNKTSRKKYAGYIPGGFKDYENPEIIALKELEAQGKLTIVVKHFCGGTNYYYGEKSK